MKKLGLIMTLLVSVFIFSSCTNKEESSKDNTSKKEINMIMPNGLLGISVAKNIYENKAIEENINVNYEVEKTPDALVSKLMKKEADIAIVPSNIAAQVYNKNLGYKIAGTIGFGSLYVVSSESKNIANIKELTSIGKGMTPDIVFQNILKKNNMENKININYASAGDEIAQRLISGDIKSAVLSEPTLTMVKSKVNNLNIVMDLNEEWKKIYKTEEGFPQSTLIVKEELLKDNKGFINKLKNEIENNIKLSYEDKKKAGEYTENTPVAIKKEITENALSRGNIKFVDIEKTKDMYREYFKILYEFNPKVIGEKIPDDGIFMEK